MNRGKRLSRAKKIFSENEKTIFWQSLTTGHLIKKNYCNYFRYLLATRIWTKTLQIHDFLAPEFSHQIFTIAISLFAFCLLNYQNLYSLYKLTQGAFWGESLGYEEISCTSYNQRKAARPPIGKFRQISPNIEIASSGEGLKRFQLNINIGQIEPLPKESAKIFFDRHEKNLIQEFQLFIPSSIPRRCLAPQKNGFGPFFLSPNDRLARVESDASRHGLAVRPNNVLEPPLATIFSKAAPWFWQRPRALSKWRSGFWRPLAGFSAWRPWFWAGIALFQARRS